MVADMICNEGTCACTAPSIPSSACTSRDTALRFGYASDILPLDGGQDLTRGQGLFRVFKDIQRVNNASSAFQIAYAHYILEVRDMCQTWAAGLTKTGAQANIKNPVMLIIVVALANVAGSIAGAGLLRLFGSPIYSSPLSKADWCDVAAPVR